MAFRELDYQTRALDALNAYLDALAGEKVKADKVKAVIADNPDLGLEIPDFPAKAWGADMVQALLPASRKALPYSPRISGHGEPVPNATLKVPTGGGKTYLACSAISRIFGRYLGKNTGFVLWIVPNEAIYSQTVKALKNRQHPYRQILDRAAAGRVKILEKGDPLNRADVDANLCIMVLMLQSGNRQNKDSLKLFQDRGDVHGFTPPESDQAAHKALLQAVSNLDQYDLGDGGPAWPMVKDSAGNALRIIRPVVIMDEGHKAISDLAFGTLYGFNPLFVLELSATPKDMKASKTAAGRTANILVEIMGRELEREGMIKMPLNIVPMGGIDWQDSLRASLDKLNALQASAREYRGNGGGYIRPILLVQAERTGKEQRDGGFIHADDVKEWLLAAGLDEAEIAIKTAEVNDLAKSENADLLSPQCRVRVIITKSALAEGWDCPFAYVLCSLAATGNESAMTQLVGRILRQPHAMRTGIEALDESYIFTHRAETANVVKAIKQGLEEDGMGDLVQDISLPSGTANAPVKRKIERRDNFRMSHIAMPQVLWLEEGQKARLLDAETDLFPSIDWALCDIEALAETLPKNAHGAASQLVRMRTGDHGDLITEAATLNDSQRAFDTPHAVQMVNDIVPNPYVARELFGRLLSSLAERGFDPEMIGRMTAFIIEEMRKYLANYRESASAQIFEKALEEGRIQFALHGDDRDWIAPKSIWINLPENAPQLMGETGSGLERSLFLPIFASELNQDEKSVALYLDKQAALKWWHRNGIDRNSYALRGWRKGNVYPDFVFNVNEADKNTRLVALETKGDQLGYNLDTEYKKQLMAKLKESFANRTAEKLEYDAAVVLISNWKNEIPKMIKG